MDIVVTRLQADPARAPVEVVERKGKGHPDTVCDALAEALSGALVRAYRDRFGSIFHHNVDKTLLWAGSSRAAFGGGEILAPMEIYLAGRATTEVDGARIDLEDLVHETVKGWLGSNLHAMDPDRHVRTHTLIRPGSRELVALFRSQERAGEWLANDSSCGVGFAPATTLERVVLQVERSLTDLRTVTAHPEIGEDVKVLGLRRGADIQLVVSTAMVGPHLVDLEAYRAGLRKVEEIARSAALPLVEGRLEVLVNAADDLERGNVYLTVTGTSGEAGDDGQAGRGNRVGGLITPGRPMVMESAAGKNPITHPGKLYSVVAQRIAEALVVQMDDVQSVHCLLMSRIGHPVRRPPLVDIRLAGPPAPALQARTRAIREIAVAELDRMDSLWLDLLEERVTLF